MVETQSQKKITNKTKSFHFRYLELCRSKNYAALSDVKAKNNNTTILEFFGDKLKIEDWLLIIDALYNDVALHSMAIRLRRTCNMVLEGVDTERKARMYKNKPVVFTKFIFSGLVEAISNCIKNNKNLTSVSFEGLPLVERYVVNISKALSSNEVLQSVSFSRSPLGDVGCETICSTMKHLPNIESLNLSQCDLTIKGAASIADMIKFQKICRFSEGWMKSLRYRDVDPESIRGLKQIFLNHNPCIKDEGISLIADVLKEDAWIKVVEMEDCGLTDIGATHVLQCLESNETLTAFNLKNNSISEHMLKNIKTQFCSEADCIEEQSGLIEQKSSVSKIRDRLKLLEEQIATETFRRKNTENLNEHLHEQIQNYKKLLLEKEKSQIPEGYVIIEKKSLDEIKRQRDEFRKALSSLKRAKSKSQKKHKIRKAKSETINKYAEHTIQKYSKSEHGIYQSENSGFEDKKVYIERDVGDSQAVDSHNCKPANFEMSESSNFCGMEALQIFVKKKGHDTKNSLPSDRNMSVKSLFLGCKLSERSSRQ